MKKINKFALCTLSTTLLMLASCGNYDGSKLEEMTDSDVTFSRATAVVQNCAFGQDLSAAPTLHDISEIVDCYLIITDFNGTETSIKLDKDLYTSEVFESAVSNGNFSMRLQLKRNENPVTYTSYEYKYVPGKLTTTIDVAREKGDTTYTYSCANAEMSGTLTGDTIDKVLQPVSEEKIRTWMKNIYDNGGIYGYFEYFLNEKGWPVAIIRNDQAREYDFEN